MLPKLLSPLPPQEICKAVLRAVGLELVALYLPSIKKLRAKSSSESASGEQPKVIFRHDFFLALGRCSVHLIPMTVFAGLLWVNYHTLYIGPSFVVVPEMDNVFLAIIQLAAKAQELLCVGSLSAIVLHRLRQELLGDGIPLGLLGSGFWYNSLSSFWSPEFWCTLPWSRQGYRKARLVVLLILAGGLAAVVGPASAILMLPRVQYVPAGGTSFYLDGQDSDYWPDVVTATSQPDFCMLPNATEYAVCPSGGYDSLRHIFGTVTINHTNPCKWWGNNYAPACQAIGLESSRLWNTALIQTTPLLLPSVLSSFQNFGFLERTVVRQPHAASIVHMQRLLNVWNGISYNSTRQSYKQFAWTYELQALGSATSPLVRSRCGVAQNLSADATEAEFPYLWWNQDYDPDFAGLDTFGIGKKASIPPLGRNESNRIRTQWISLPADEFGDPHFSQTAVGLLIDLPWHRRNGQSRLVIGCAVAAAWHRDTVRSSRSATYSAWVIPEQPHEHNDSPDDPEWSRPIQMDRSWLQSLTATSPDLGGSSTG